MTRGDKCALLGDNGTGKSTLLKKLVENKDQAIKFGRFVRLACYDQEHANLDPENEVLYELWGRHVNFDQTRVRSILASAGLVAEDMEKKVRMLSGGERAKLALAVFECEQGNTLFLDEPTNHLDLAARESLEASLKNFEGTLLFVSHDRYFIRALAGKIFELENGNLHCFAGGYDDFTAYKNSLKEPAQRTPAPTECKKIEEKSTYYRSKEERAADARKRTRVNQIEKEIATLETEESDLSASLSDPEVTSNFPLLTKKCNRLEEIKSKLDALYNEYETLI